MDTSNMEIQVVADHARVPPPVKTSGDEEETDILNIQRVQELASEARKQEKESQDGASAGEVVEEDTHTDLPLVMRRGRNAPQRTQSYGAVKPRTPNRSRGIRPSRSARGTRRPPGRSVSNDGLPIRGVQRNRSFEGQPGSVDFVSRGINRTRSGDSFISTESENESCFTTDSISLRKSQLIADPLDGDYTEAESYAEHESVFDSFSIASRESRNIHTHIIEYLPDGRPAHLAKRQAESDADLAKLSIHLTDACDISFYSGASYSSLEEEEDHAEHSNTGTYAFDNSTDHTETDHFGEDSNGAEVEEEEDDTEETAVENEQAKS